VLNTASKDDDSRQHLRLIGKTLLSWYSDEFVVRHRRCGACKHEAITVEIEARDLIKICQICATEGVPPDVSTDAPFVAVRRN
jgi:hypothetical protein